MTYSFNISDFIAGHFRRIFFAIGIIGLILSVSLVSLNAVDKMNSAKATVYTKIHIRLQSFIAMKIRGENEVLTDSLSQLEKEIENFRIHYQLGGRAEQWGAGEVSLSFGGKNYGLIVFSPIYSKIITLSDIFWILASTICPIFPLYLISEVIKKKLNQSIGSPLKKASELFAHSIASEPRYAALDFLIKETNIEELKLLFTKIEEHLRRIDRVETELKKAVTEQAIARTTQSLAHDVRKPFTLFKMIIDLVEGEEEGLEAKRILREALPEVQHAIASVNGMISDILEIGSESSLTLEPESPETLIDTALTENFRLYPGFDLKLDYSMNHKHMVLVDKLKIARLFSNIVDNAIQAAGPDGRLFFATKECSQEGVPIVQICIGNSGKVIPQEHLAHLFDAFFTSSKKGGTGLGLAIAQKIVLAHGGKIWCESNEEIGVKFFFTLPISKVKSNFWNGTLPSSSAEIAAKSERSKKSALLEPASADDSLEISLEMEIIRAVTLSDTPYNLLIVDDDSISRKSTAALIARSEGLKKSLTLTFAKNSEEAIEGLNTQPSLVILDVDLGDKSLNGYEVLGRFRSLNYPGTVCIHSNRSLFADYSDATEAGADAVLPKPMSRAQLLKLILFAAKKDKKFAAGFIDS